MPSRPRLYFIDGTALIFRAYYAFERNPLRTRDGRNTSALYGTLMLVRGLLDTLSPERWAIALDTKGPTFRHERYPEYKAHRPPAPEELSEQIPWIKDALDALRVPRIELPGFEADDVIATLVARAVEEGYDAVVVSNDKDLFQLVTDRVHVLRPVLRTGGTEFTELDADGVVEKIGVRPDQVPDYLGLVGDASDNIPGVPLIGAKTAAELLTRFGSLEAILEHAPSEKKGKRWENLVAHAEDARLSKKLATVRYDVPLSVDLDKLAVVHPDAHGFSELCRRFEMPSLIERFIPQDVSFSVGEERDYSIVDDTDQLREFAERAEAAGNFAIDVETTSLDPLEADLVGVAMSHSPATGVYIPIAHRDGPNLSWREVAGVLQPLLGRTRKVLHNAKYDLAVLSRHGADLGPFDDTLLMSYLLAPTARAHNLDTLASSRLGVSTTPISELIGSGKDQRSFAETDVSSACDYAAEDADIALRLYNLLESEIREAGLSDVYERCELPLVPVLVAMESEGVRVDTELLGEYSEEIDGRLDQLREEVYDIAGHEFNLNSTQQLAEVLFDELDLPVIRKTKTGRSTDARVLEELSGYHDLPRLLLEHRTLAKLKGTYVDALPRLVNPDTGRVHTSFNQAVVATGRLASSDPNLQNIPVRTPEGRRIREAFVPRDDGHVIVSFDYSQIELRILAHLSEDEHLCSAFERGLDVHAATASAVFGIEPGEVTPEMRAVAKVVNFSAVYGTSAFGLSRQSMMTHKEAKAFLDAYFKRYSGVKCWTDRVVEDAREGGAVRTMLGRLRPVPDVRSSDRNARQAAERAAVNTPVQGSAADMIKLAMVSVHRALEDRGLSSKMVLQVHDELVFDAKRSELDELTPLVVGLMSSSLPLSVPVEVDVGVGESWAEAH